MTKFEKKEGVFYPFDSENALPVNSDRFIFIIIFTRY